MSILSLLKARLGQGHRTMPFPTDGTVLPDGFRGRPVLDPGRCPPGCGACAAACPTGAITGNPPRLDLGACVFCPDCVDACGPGGVRWTPDHRVATRRREDLVLDGGPMRLAEALDARARKLYGRSLKLRQVSAGGCNACEAELNVSQNVVFDLGRYGVQFVASPRHADGLVVTGPVTANMRQALLDTWAAIPSPRLCIVVGACAIAGGPFAGSPQCLGMPAEIPVDLYVPGCPPHPVQFLDAVVRLLGRA